MYEIDKYKKQLTSDVMKVVKYLDKDYNSKLTSLANLGLTIYEIAKMFEIEHELKYVVDEKIGKQL